MIQSTAPGRCGIVGNPTDMYGGSVLSIATAERACCRIEDAPVLSVESCGQRCEIRSCDDITLQGDCLDIARAVLTYLEIDATSKPFHMALSTDIPMQAGMAGSTALVVAALGALNRRLHLGLHPWAIAETARKIEFRVMHVLCGFQDQHMAVFGGLNYMQFGGKEMLEQRDDEPLAVIEPLAPYVASIPLIAAHTGVRHNSGTVHRHPRERWLAGDPEVIDGYATIAAIAPAAKRAVLSGDWPALGALMNENHRIVAKLGGSGEVNDRLIAAALDAGAFGAKLAGAGGGGTILVLAQDCDRVAEALRLAGADRILVPEAGPGLTVTEAPDEQ